MGRLIVAEQLAPELTPEQHAEIAAAVERGDAWTESGISLNYGNAEAEWIARVEQERNLFARLACLVDLERRYLQSDRTVSVLHINAVRATFTPDEWQLIRQLSDEVRTSIRGAHTVTPKEHQR